MNLRHFTKVTNGVPMYDTAGRVIPFQRLSDGLGCISTDDPDVLTTLDKFIKQRVGGVTEVSQVELEELKKKAPNSMPSNDNWFGGTRAAVDTSSTPSPPPSADLAAVVGSTMAPLSEEVSQLRKDLAALKEQKAGPTVEKDIPPPTPPVVGKRVPVTAPLPAT